MKKSILSILCLLFLSITIQSQTPKKLNSNEIYQSIQKLNFLGSVLYLAAHPDDENTRLISYFSNKIHARTAYLSITRGDGGQNLIGPEIRELLGVIRTNELLMARTIDGGEQFFTRANDFGYSKHPDETLHMWNKEEVLSDVVRVIRKFQPDIIINRFNVESAGKTHGHHTSSAMLSAEAFDLAANSDYKLNGLNPWSTQRLFFNTSWWFYGSKENFAKADKSDMIAINTGVYFPSSGLSNTEIASLSRSMHKSQGFGSSGTRGIENEYIKLLKGKLPKNENNLFEGINTTWTRVKGGAEIKKILDKVEINFDFKDPSASIPDLLIAYKLIGNLENEHWRKYKLQQIKEIIAASSGLYLEGKASSSYATINEPVEIAIEAINRSDQNIVLEEIKFYPQNKTIEIKKSLKNNVPYTSKEKVIVSNKLSNTTPYWLIHKGTLGMYNVEDKSLIGEPTTLRQFKIEFKLRVNNTPINYTKEIIYKYNDPVKGEVYQPFEIVPIVSSSIASRFIIFNENTPKEIPVKIVTRRDSVQGIAELKVPKNWKVNPASIPFSILEKGNEKMIVFTVTPTKKQSEGYIYSSIQSENKTFNNSLVEINYNHIPKQTILIPAEAKVVRLNLVKKGNSVGYIKGAGDEVPKYLKQVGYQVTIIDPFNISENILKEFDAVMIGIRAYNTVDELKLKQPIILDYVKNGGNLIVQYNTSRGLKIKDNIAPYKLHLSSDRVTDENAKVEFLDKDNEVLNYPNKITIQDFDGWVQERGLYFPDEWANEFTPILSFHDKGESPKNGSLLVAKYGKGYYIYTGLSFFRELPAGVPGAYKLLTNMISIGKNDFEEEIKK
jgi:LmbE family N-acetylglucosaminyl deacetylase